METEVVIIGGGPAGLSAALVLGRCRRRVVLFDHGRYRNARARSLNGYLTRDGIAPGELRRIARGELARYATVELRQAEVVAVRAVEAGFEVEEGSGVRTACRKLLLATGLVDKQPSLPGLDELIGVSAFHCPYCDGWELRDQALVAYGPGDAGAALALELTLWSPDVVLCTGGEAPGRAMRERLERFAIETCPLPITSLTGGALHVRVAFDDGSALTRRALFYAEGCEQGAALAAQLGVDFTPQGGCRPDVSRRRTSRASTSPATPLATRCKRSSPPAKGAKPRSPSIKPSSKKTSCTRTRRRPAISTDPHRK